MLKLKASTCLYEGSRLYRDARNRPMASDCYGQGPCADLLEGVEGVENAGLSGLAISRAANCGCFVLPSRYEAWGVAIAEACLVRTANHM